MVPSWTPDPPAEDAPEPGPDDEGAPNEPASPEPNAPSSAPATRRWLQLGDSVARVGLSASLPGQETAMK